MLYLLNIKYNDNKDMEWCINIYYIIMNSAEDVNNNVFYCVPGKFLKQKI